MTTFEHFAELFKNRSETAKELVYDAERAVGTPSEWYALVQELIYEAEYASALAGRITRLFDDLTREDLLEWRFQEEKWTRIADDYKQRWRKAVDRWEISGVVYQ